MASAVKSGSTGIVIRMTPAFELTHLTVRFGDFIALDDISLVLPEGAFLALVGPNGAGKSTLVRTLLGLISPSSGQVRVLGESPGHLQGIGYVPQIKTFDRSFPAVALELVLTGLRRAWVGRISSQDRSLALDALDQVGLKHLGNRALGRLSGGELQRVYLARALVRRPRLIVLDEPATGIDVLAEKDMYNLLETYRSTTKATLAMITHDLDVARYHASHVAILNRKLYGFGFPVDIMQADILARAYGHAHHTHTSISGGS